MGEIDIVWIVLGVLILKRLGQGNQGYYQEQQRLQREKDKKYWEEYEKKRKKNARRGEVIATINRAKDETADRAFKQNMSHLPSRISKRIIKTESFVTGLGNLR